jgi:hypothetical protein
MEPVDLQLRPTPRSWMLLDNFIMDSKSKEIDSEVDDIISDVATGLIGPSETAAWLSFIKENNNLKINIKEIEKKYIDGALQKKVKFARDMERIDVLNQACEVFISDVFSSEKFLENENFRENIMQFLIDLPKELSIKVIKGIYTNTSKEKKIPKKLGNEIIIKFDVIDIKEIDERQSIFLYLVNNKDVYNLIKIFEDVEK